MLGVQGFRRSGAWVLQLRVGVRVRALRFGVLGFMVSG